MKKVLTYFNGFELSLIIGMLVVNYLTGGFADPLWGICSVTGVLCVVLVAKGKLSNYAFGLINVALYAFLSYQAKLYGEVMLNAGFYLPVQFIGFFMWKKRMNAETKTVKAKTMSKAQMAVLVALSALGVVGYGFFLQSLGGNTPFLDSTSTVLSVIAQILMLLMFAEQWLLWIVVNIVSVAMWVIFAQGGEPGAWSMVAMWSAYLLNAVYGYINWKKMSKGA